MIYVENNCKDPFFNLALEEYLLVNLPKDHEGYLLLWQNEPTIVVGRYQNTLEEINLEFVESHNINVVRRISGGGAVYHDHGNLNYTFIVNAGEAFDFDFAAYTKPIIDILNTLNVHAELSSRNDLTIEGKKFSGNAQHISNGKLLHHGTLLFDSDLEMLSKALKVSEDKFISKGIKSIRSRVTNISDYLPTKMTIHSFKETIINQLCDAKLISSRITPTEKVIAEVAPLADNKYRQWEWNFGKSPEFTEKKSKRFPWGKVEAFINVKNGVITNCKFYGDFFGNGDIKDVEKVIEGTVYKKDDIQKKLEHIDIEYYFKGINKLEFVEFLAP
ncbi:MAG: lipoate---protein ligase [Thermococcaceae archaeon]|nr:lipoate---protein ligase [Thermococcaceae archaeon]